MDGWVGAVIFAVVGWTLAIAVYFRRRAFREGFEALVENNPDIYRGHGPSPFQIRVGFWLAWSLTVAFAVLFTAVSVSWWL